MMTRKTSVKGAARAQRSAEKHATDAITLDSFQNFAMQLGLGTDNPSSWSTYGFNPITRNRILLEWMHRGSWIAGLAVDIPAEDMTKAGLEYHSTITPDAIERLDAATMNYDVWGSIRKWLKWGRLYGGAILVPLIDGQDLATPLRLETVGKGQFKGLLVLDRWMIDASMEDLVTDFGPSLGLPKYYRVQSNAPALRGAIIHHSRAFRAEGIELPYQQRLMENLWSLSVLERINDRLIAFDSATTGAAQLVYKSYLRVIKIKELRENIAAGNDMLKATTTWLDLMRRFQGIEGLTIIDGDDEFEASSHSAFAGLSDALLQFAQQLSGALQIPLVRMYGQSPSGLNSSGNSELITYSDGVVKDQNRDLRMPVLKINRIMAASEGILLPPNFGFEFKNIYQLTAEQKATISNTTADAISKMLDAGVLDIPTGMKEFRQSARTTGIGSNITDKAIADAIANPPVPALPDAPVPEPGQEGQEPSEGRLPLRAVK